MGDEGQGAMLSVRLLVPGSIQVEPLLPAQLPSCPFPKAAESVCPLSQGDYYSSSSLKMTGLGMVDSSQQISTSSGRQLLLPHSRSPGRGTAQAGSLAKLPAHLHATS